MKARDTTTMLMVAALALTACTTVPPDDHGVATRAWVAQQVRDPGAAARNGITAPEGTDPGMAIAAVESARRTDSWSGSEGTRVINALGGGTGQ